MEDVYVVPFTKKIFGFLELQTNGIVVVVRNWIGLFHFYCHSLVSEIFVSNCPCYTVCSCEVT